MSHIIGLGHYARVGKDEVGRILVKRHGFTQIAFADALKAMAYESSPAYRQMLDEHGPEAAKLGHRQYLIDLGNSARRHLGPAVWVDAVFRTFEPGGRYVITDCRYPNEVERVQSAGGLLVRVLRPGVGPGDNVADRALLDFDGWAVDLANDGTLEDLISAVDELADLAIQPLEAV